MKSLLEASAQVRKFTETKYQAFFQKAMKKFGIEKLSDLKGDEKKKFYDYVDRNWNSEDEAGEDGVKEARNPNKSGGSGYDLYHKDFSTAMQHAYKYAKEKLGIEIDPKEIDDKVASGPRKPSSGKTNSYRLTDKSGKKAVQIQVANLDNKKFELNMYKEEVELDEAREDTATQVARALKKMGVKPNAKEADIIKKIPVVLKKMGLENDKLIKRDPDFIGDVIDSMNEEVELDEAVDAKKVVAYLVKKGSNPKDAEAMVKKEFDGAIKAYPKAPVAKIAEYIMTVSEDTFTYQGIVTKGLLDLAKKNKVKAKQKGDKVELSGDKTNVSSVVGFLGLDEELTEKANFSDKQIKMAFGILNDPRWKSGNMTAIVKKIEQIAKGLSKHPSVEKAIRATNEDVELTEESSTIKKIKQIVDKKQAMKVDGQMVDMFTASAIAQIYDKVNDSNKAKMDKLKVSQLASVAMKMMKAVREDVELAELFEGKLAQQWMKGAKSIKQGDFELTRGTGGVHTIYKNGKKFGDLSLDDSDMWVSNMKGMKGQWTGDSIDDLFVHLKKAHEEAMMCEKCGKMHEGSCNSEEVTESFKKASMDLTKYAKQSGGGDKSDFLKVAKMLSDIGRADLMKKSQLLGKLNDVLRDMDTDPRDKVYEIIKGAGLMESLNEAVSTAVKIDPKEFEKSRDELIDLADKMKLDLSIAKDKSLVLDSGDRKAMQNLEKELKKLRVKYTITD
jgi:hypothetical protein